MIMRFGACLDMITVRNKRVNGRVIISMGIKSLMHPLTNLLILECMYVCKLYVNVGCDGLWSPSD
jgi:hypothetical protein